MPDVPLCVDGTFPAVIRVALSEGCIAYPDDREQDLCLQHIYSIQPRGEIEIITVYNEPVWAWYQSTRGAGG